jgi:hypothetical protein
VILLAFTEKEIRKDNHVIGNGSSPFVALAGLYSVVVVSFATKTILEALRLNRKQGEDEGFYRLDVLPWKDRSNVNYESGVALLDENGKAIWHDRLDWGDVLSRHDDSSLYFTGESEEGTYEWTISIADGVREE